MVGEQLLFTSLPYQPCCKFDFFAVVDKISTSRERLKKQICVNWYGMMEISSSHVVP